MKIRTAIFVVYVAVSAVGFAVLLGLVLRDVRLRYIESMRRTLGDTAAFLAVLAADSPTAGNAWAQKLTMLPPQADLLRVFATDTADRVLFDSAHARDVGQTYSWPMTGGGRAASENYSIANVAVVADELRVRAAVRSGGELIGWVGVGRPLASIAEGVTAARRSIFWSAMTLAGFMVAAGWWIASRLTHSLERLTAYALAVRDGRRASPPASRAKEIAALSRAFEEMRVALEGKAHVEHYTQALAHELKAPLSAIRGAAELLNEDMPRADRARFTANLRAESERLQLIVDRLLELAALEARPDGAGSAEVELREVLDQVAETAAARATARGVAFSRVDEASPRVAGDRFLLSQAVSNLVQNAVDFTPPGGTVTLTLKTEARHAVVIVEDTGPGVPDYALEKVFERFFSLPRPSTGRKSSGLGLTIVREVARLHGGEVMLRNRPAGGACAELRLPLR